MKNGSDFKRARTRRKKTVGMAASFGIGDRIVRATARFFKPPPRVSTRCSKPTMVTTRALRRFFARSILLLFGLAVGLLVAEVALRVMGISYPLPYMADPHVGSRLQPGFSAWFTQEGHAFVRINRAGFRDREHAIEKPADTVRIAVLGDSFAEAVQVPLEETFWSLLAEELRRRGVFGSRNVEILNFGVSGHGTAQQLQMLRHHVWPYQPDIVLLAFFGGNDVRNNSRELEPDTVRPFFTVVGDRLALDESFLEHPDFKKATSDWVAWKVRLINSSRVLQLLRHVKEAFRRPASGAAAFEPGLDDEVYAPPRVQSWQDAWEVTDRLLVEMKREVEAHDAQFVVALVTQAIEVHPDPNIRAGFAKHMRVDDLSYPQRRLSQLGREHDFTVVPLAEPLAAFAERENAFLHGFPNTVPGTGHWNAEGHRQAALQIADHLDTAWQTSHGTTPDSPKSAGENRPPSS